MNSKILAVSWIAFAMAGAADAQHPAVDAPTAAGIEADAFPHARAGARDPVTHDSAIEAPRREKRPAAPDVGHSRAPSSVSGVPSTEAKVEGSAPINGGGIGSADGKPAAGRAHGGSDERGAGAPAPDRTANQAGSGTLKDAIELCERLAGVEREICLRQAQENRARALAPGIGATPDRGSAGAAGGGQQTPGSSR